MVQKSISLTLFIILVLKIYIYCNFQLLSFIFNMIKNDLYLLRLNINNTYTIDAFNNYKNNYYF